MNESAHDATRISFTVISVNALNGFIILSPCADYDVADEKRNLSIRCQDKRLHLTYKDK